MGVGGQSQADCRFKTEKMKMPVYKIQCACVSSNTVILHITVLHDDILE